MESRKIFHSNWRQDAKKKQGKIRKDGTNLIKRQYGPKDSQLEKWINCNYRKTDYDFTQLTGHGSFGTYTKKSDESNRYCR